MNLGQLENIHRSRWVSVVLLTLWLDTPSALELPQISGGDTVSECEFIAVVEGSSGLKKTTNWQKTAQEAALIQAAKLNASHVVLDSVMAVSSESGIVTGKAYQCKN